MCAEDDDKFRYYKRVIFFPATCYDCGVKIGFFKVKHKVLINNRLTYLCTRCKDLRVSGTRNIDSKEKEDLQIKSQKENEIFNELITDEFIINFVNKHKKLCMAVSVCQEKILDTYFVDDSIYTTSEAELKNLWISYNNLVKSFSSNEIDGFKLLNELPYTFDFIKEALVQPVFDNLLDKPKGFDFIRFDLLEFVQDNDKEILYNITKWIKRKYGNIKTNTLYRAFNQLASKGIKHEIKDVLNYVKKKEDYYRDFIESNPNILKNYQKSYYKELLKLIAEVLFEQGLIKKNSTDLLVQELDEYSTDIELTVFERKMINEENHYISINDIDLMTGIEFEHFVGGLLEKMGYSAEVTKASGDQGADLIIKKNNLKTVVQAKCYSGSVSNKAIQEVVASIKYYKADGGMVVTNSTFTKGAKELADSNDIRLIDRNRLIELLNRYEV